MPRLVLVTIAAWCTVAAAEPGRRVFVDTPREAYTPQAAKLSPYLYLNRCTGGCMVTGGSTNDAAHQMSTIPSPGTYTVGEFATFDGQTGAAADADWHGVVQCMQQVYSPFAITVTDTVPQGVSYTEAIIAGQPTDIGEPTDILGIAPLAGDCSAQENVISFSFANHHANTERVYNICWTAAQESAHAFGLDHEYQFDDAALFSSDSACDDPMTYRVDCGGEKFFRNKPAVCGENAPRNCRCGGKQNSHQKVLSVFGAGSSTAAPPTVAIVVPAQNATIANGSVIHAGAGAQRGVAKVELWLNGSKWSELEGAAFDINGQNPAYDYTLPLPGGVPDSIIDIVVKAYDDLGSETDSATVTVLKGAACVDASTCARDQKCASGKCYWDPPTAELGASCSYGQFCKSWLCLDTGGGGVCTQDCEGDDPTSCPMGFSCVDASGRSICLTTTSGGCCSAGGAGGWAHGGLAALVLGLMLRRRRGR